MKIITLITVIIITMIKGSRHQDPVTTVSINTIAGITTLIPIVICAPAAPAAANNTASPVTRFDDINPALPRKKSTP